MEQRNRQAHKQQRSSPKTPFWAIALVIFCTILVAYTQFLLKSRLERSSALLIDPLFYFGLLLLIICGFLITAAFKAGELSVLHPLIGTGIFWATLFSVFFLGENISSQHLLGIVAIIAGIGFITHSSRRTQ